MIEVSKIKTPNASFIQIQKASFSLKKLESVFEMIFPELAKAFKRQVQKSTTLNKSLSDRCQKNDFRVNIKENKIYLKSRSEFLTELYKGFVPCYFDDDKINSILHKELNFEMFPFTSNLSDGDSFMMSVIETHRIINSLEDGTFDGPSIYLAVAGLYLKRFYEAYPEMIGPSKVDVQYLFEERLSPKESKKIVSFTKQIKITALILALKVLNDDIGLYLGDIFDALKKSKCFSDEFIIRLNEVEPTKELIPAQKRSFESLNYRVKRRQSFNDQTWRFELRQNEMLDVKNSKNFKHLKRRNSVEDRLMGCASRSQAFLTISPESPPELDSPKNNITETIKYNKTSKRVIDWFSEMERLFLKAINYDLSYDQIKDIENAKVYLGEDEPLYRKQQARLLKEKELNDGS